MINKVVLVGRLTTDVETKMTKSGIPFARFTLACDKNFSSKERERKADFINCVCWNQNANFIGSYGTKGSVIGIDGRVETGSYVNNEGSKVYTTDIICDNVRIISSKKNEGSRDESSYMHNDTRTSQPASFSEQYVSNDTQSTNDYLDDGLEIDISTDDLPF